MHTLQAALLSTPAVGRLWGGRPCCRQRGQLRAQARSCEGAAASSRRKAARAHIRAARARWGPSCRRHQTAVAVRRIAALIRATGGLCSDGVAGLCPQSGRGSACIGGPDPLQIGSGSAPHRPPDGAPDTECYTESTRGEVANIGVAPSLARAPGSELIGGLAKGTAALRGRGGAQGRETPRGEAHEMRPRWDRSLSRLAKLHNCTLAISDFGEQARNRNSRSSGRSTPRRPGNAKARSVSARLAGRIHVSSVQIHTP